MYPQQPTPVAPPPIMPTPPKSKWQVVAFVFIGVSVVAIVAAIIFLVMFISREEAIGNVESSIAAAKKEQADADEAEYLALQNATTIDFAGPDDYGRLAFKYPKHWSVYVENDASNSNAYEAYLNPVVVPTVNNNARFGLRVLIENKEYDRVVSTYSSLVQKGDLSSGVVTVNGQSGTRLNGNFTKDIKGSAVIFKIRDKTVTLRTDAETFLPVFDELIASVTFNQ